MPITAEIIPDDYFSRNHNLFALIRKNIAFALDDWGKYITSDYTLKIAVNYLKDDYTTTIAQAGSENLNFIGYTDDNVALYMSGAASAINQGSSNSKIDISIDITSHGLNNAWLDNNPIRSDSISIPTKKIDMVSILAHEIGHGLGINGFSTMENNQLSSIFANTFDPSIMKFATTFDKYIIKINNDFYFNGPNTVAYYGAAAPLATDSLFHFNNKDDLMYPYASLGKRISVSTLDLAVLADTGLIVNNIGTSKNSTIVGTADDDVLGGFSNAMILNGNAGNDILTGSDNLDVALYQGARKNYKIKKTSTGFTVADQAGKEGQDTLNKIDKLKFADINVNLNIGEQAKTIDASVLKSLEELYIGFLGRIPDADGLSYWITQFKAGQTLKQISNSFYIAALALTDTSGYSENMSNSEFINAVYKNVLGRTGNTAPSEADVQYWNNELLQGATKGSVVVMMLYSAHTLKGDKTWGWCVNLLDNKASVANYAAVEQGLSYEATPAGITQAAHIAASVTPTDTTLAISLIGVNDADFNLF